MGLKSVETQTREKDNRPSKIKQFLNSTRAENLILMLYTAFCFYLVLVHEPWRDEAQFWLLARDATLPEILGNISKEGIPPLWQLILKPFVLSGLPYYPTMSIISTLLVTAAAWIFVKNAPFRRAVKYVLLFSPVFIYCYSTISRSYALMPIVVVLLAIVFPKRLQRPVIYGLLLAVLFEIHVFLWGMVAALAVEYLISTIQAYRIDKSIKNTAKSLTAAIPLLIVGLQYLIFFYPGAKVSYTLGNLSTQMNPIQAIYQLVFGVGSVFANTLLVQEHYGVFFALILFALALSSIIRDKRWVKYVLIAGVSILFEGIVSGFVYADGNFRSISIFLILAFVLWLAKKDNLPTEISLFNSRTTWVAVVCAYTFFGMLAVVPNIKGEIQLPFSYSRDTAVYIEQNIPADSLILTSSSPQMSAVSAYLEDYTFYDSEKQKPFTYFVWDNNDDWVSLYGVEIDGEKQLSKDDRLRRVAQEAIALSSGTEEGFYYLSVLDNMTRSTDTFYLEHVIFYTPDAYGNKENYEILYIPFDEAKQWIESEGNHE